jgi:DNA-binding NarL/FixJ family response regulator
VIRVLLADDHVLVCRGFAALLRAEPDFEVVGEVADGEAALARIEALRPDVAVVDIGMPGLTGIEVARRVRDAGVRTAVVVLSRHREPSFVTAALEAGASGYVVKESEPRELVEALRVAARGEVYLSPCIASAVARALRDDEDGAAEPELAERERDVLRLLVEGLSSKEVAARLGLSVRTAEGVRGRIMSKLGIHHLPGLTKYAIRHHLTELGG